MANEVNKKELETVSGGAGLFGKSNGHNGWNLTGKDPIQNDSGYLCPYCEKEMESRGRQINTWFGDNSWFLEYVCHSCDKHFALFEDDNTWYER